jgi:hypothetical protein
MRSLKARDRNGTGRGALRRIDVRALIVASCCVLAVWNSRALALDIEQIQWGFDGQVVGERFNLLSVLISNTSPQSFDGRVELRKSVNGLVVDAPIVETVYLAPHTSRWVQFFPYMKLDWEEWRVSWGPADPGSKDLPKPRQGRPACVLLEDPDVFSMSGGDIKRFPTKLFPVSLTGTDGLHSVVLDHSPRWEEARQRAFLDWLRNGGQVHVVQTRDGAFPEFTGPLKVLDVPGSPHRVGLGMVYRHERDRRRLDKTFVDQVIVSGRSTAEVAAAQALTSTSEPKPGKDAELADSSTFFSMQWDGDGPFLSTLRKMSRPDHTWILIHLLSLLYLLLVFPGCYLLGKKRAGDYRAVFGMLAGVIVFFSLAFLFVGRRGYGERTVVYSAAIARATDDGRCDVSGWSNAFVVDGGAYTLSHAGTGRIYSSCQSDEPVPGEIHSGSEARLSVDMPPYSSRTFGYRLVSAEPPLTASIAEWESEIALRQESVTLRDLTRATLPPRAERVLTSLIILKGANFPAAYQEMYAVHGRRVYSLVDVADRLEMKSEVGSLATFLRLDEQNAFDMFNTDWVTERVSIEEMFQSLHRPLFARSFGIMSQRDAVQVSVPDDRVRLLVYAPMPASMRVTGEQFGAQQGYVLYTADIFPARNP